jgi:hypothetical protein
MMERRAPRFLLEGAIQRFSEVMDLLWFVETMHLDNATSRPWMMECRTPRFLLEGAIQHFSEATAVLWLAERTFMENVLFRRLKQGRSMFALRCKVETLCCSLILFVRRMKCG